MKLEQPRRRLHAAGSGMIRRTVSAQMGRSAGCWDAQSTRQLNTSSGTPACVPEIVTQVVYNRGCSASNARAAVIGRRRSKDGVSELCDEGLEIGRINPPWARGGGPT